ncbi:MAG: MerC domain-containing protein [Gammaproteobacteria bacterium]
MLQIKFDRLAIALSSICAIHCAIFPIIASLIPLLSTTIHHGHALHEFWFHQFILIFILPVSILATISGYRFHRNILPTIITLLGLTILVFTAVYAGTLIANHTIPHAAETWLTIIGGTIHATGHMFNLIATRKFNVKFAH